MNESQKDFNIPNSDNITVKSTYSKKIEIALAILALIFLALFIIFLILYINEKNKINKKNCDKFKIF